MPSSEKQPSRVPMWNGVKVSYTIILMCLFPLAIGGYWTYGQMVRLFHSLKFASARTYLHKLQDIHNPKSSKIPKTFNQVWLT